MDELIRKLKAATEGSRELDCQIALAVGWKRVLPSECRARNLPSKKHGLWLHPTDNDGGNGATLYRRDPDAFTRSLDAALMLVPEGWGEGQIDWGPNGEATVSLCVEGLAHNSVRDGTMVTVSGKTRALALCIAALKAKKESDHG